MRNAVGYIRVSTDAQAGEDRFGIDSQKEQIVEYAAENEIAITKWYVDRISGVKAERPELDKILYEDDVENPPIELVVVAKSDRLSRDINLYFNYKFVLGRKNIKLISVQEDFGSMGAFAGVLEALTMCIAEQERINIAKRTGGGRKTKSKAGGYSGGKPPYGYKSVGGQLVIVDSEAEMVRRIFDLRNDGLTFADIADVLNDENYRTRIGKRFYPSQVKGIIDNENTYRGMYKYGNMNWVQGVHSPILGVK